MFFGTPSESEINRLRKEVKSEQGKWMLNRYDSELQLLNNMRLAAIRTDSIDEKVNKSICKAQLQFDNGVTVDISYVIQMTSDGDLFAEVYGIENMYK